MVGQTNRTKSKPAFPTTLVAVAGVAVVLGAALFWYLQSSSRNQEVLGLTSEAKEYVRSLKLSDVGLKATESYLKQLVVEIEGKVTNTGNRPVDTVEVYCVFYDSIGQVVLRERVGVVRAGSGGLKPGQTRAFRLPFDNVPASWNHQAPQIVIAGIRFGE